MSVSKVLNHLWSSNQEQAISEYAVLLAMILVLVVGPESGWFKRQQCVLSGSEFDPVLNCVIADGAPQFNRPMCIRRASSRTETGVCRFRSAEIQSVV